MREKDRVVAGGGGHRVDGVGGVKNSTRKFKEDMEHSALYNLGCHLECCQENFVVSGDKSDIDALVEACDRIYFHTAWRLEDMFSYVDLSPISPGISTSTAFVFDKVCSSTITSTIAAAVSDKVSSIPDPRHCHFIR